MTAIGTIRTVDPMRSASLERPTESPVTDPVEASAGSAGAPLLRARGLVHGYGSQTVLDGIDCDIRTGDVLALCGPSGSGKTTLLHLLAGILTPWEGRIELAPKGRFAHPGGSGRRHRHRPAAAGPADRGGDVASMDEERRSALRRTRFGLVFQSGQLLDELTCAENVALPLLANGVDLDRARDQALDLFGPLGLEGLADRRPGEVSGGQRQRVALARALVSGPDVLFADEPTGALDSRTGRALMDTLLGIRRRTGIALVIVTHDPELASRCERVLRLNDGRITAAQASTAGVR